MSIVATAVALLLAARIVFALAEAREARLDREFRRDCDRLCEAAAARMAE